jgi:hypothetical protein
MKRSRISFALLTVGVLSLGGSAAGVISAHAAGAPGSNFGNINIAVTSTGIRSPFYSHSGEDVEGQAPYAEAQLQSGGVGSALTSVFWPGGTGGHGGDTLKLLAGGCVPPNPTNTIPIPIPVPIPDLPCLAHTPPLPDQVYQSMNDSYKAEVQSSDSKTTVTKSAPGVDMTATATQNETGSTTTIAGAKLPGIGDTFGTTTTTSTIKLTGPNTAVIDALAVARDIKLGGGALTISSVKSVAHAVTDGKKATGAAGTVVNGMKIGGVPVTVDNSGIHVQGQGHALPSIDALNKALKSSGFSIFVADPTKKIQGANADLFSGQLVIMQSNSQYTSNANDSAEILTFGGAGLSATTNRALQFKLPPVAQQPAASTPAAAAAAGTPPSLGSTSTPTGTTTGTQQPTVAPPLLAAAQTKLPGGIAAGWVVMALVGSGLIAAGLKRLPDHVLAETGAACPLGSDT